MTYAFLILWMTAAQADGGGAEKPAAVFVQYPPSDSERVLPAQLDEACGQLDQARGQLEGAPPVAARESPPEFSYDLYSDKQGHFSYDGAALALVKHPSHLQRVYADAARGEARPKRLIQELEYWFQQTGLAVADRTVALECLVLPELQSNCGPPNWGFIEQFLGNSPEGERLREVLAEAYARRAHQLGARNDVTVAGVNLLLVGSLAKAVLARVGVVPEAKAAGGGGRLVDLYRAVKPAELADIQATGSFRTLVGGVEGKYFTTSAEAAASYARQAVRAFGDPPYTIVRTQVPESVLRRPGISATVDRGIPAYVLPDEALPGLPYEILNYSPVPP